MQDPHLLTFVPSPRIRSRNSSQSGRVGLFVALAILGAVFFFAWRKSAGSSDDPKAKTVEEYYAEDKRIRPLLYDCPFEAAFETDTTDIAKVLASKLDAGAQLDPLQRAKTDLAKMGAAAAEPLTRLFESSATANWRRGVAKNVLAVCALSESDFGVAIAEEGLSAPAEELRADSALVLKKHGGPEHYEALEATLPGYTVPVNTTRTLEAMHAVDPGRFARSLPQWLELAPRNALDFIQSPLIDSATSLIATSDDPEIAEMLLGLADTPGLLARHWPYLLAPAARLGDEAALQRLRDSLASPDVKPRYHGMQALAAAGLHDETYVLVETVDNAAERGTVVGLLFDESADEGRTEIQKADMVELGRRLLRDPALEVQETALSGLLERGDEEAAAHLMRLLTGTIDERALGTRAMRNRLDDRPEVADQARALLIAQWDEELHGSQRAPELISILTSIGAVPGEATGQFLADAAVTVGENPIRGTSGYHWVIGQMFNAGEASQRIIRQRLQTETEPLRRIDLIQFLWQDFTEESRDLLLGVLDDDTKSPYERMYAADRVLRMGYPARVIPVIKRVYRTTKDPVLRPALHCLLWVWCGPATT